MKKLIAILFIGTLFALSPARVTAQVQISVNIDAMPQWGPAGFDRATYYYLPEAEIYYYVPGAQFVYLQGGKWRFSKLLPDYYRNLDLYSTYKVVINRPKPYRQHDYYVSHYKTYRNYHSKQGTIRDNRGQRNDNRGNVGNRVKNNPGNGHSHKMGTMQQGKNKQSTPGIKGNKGQGNKNKKGK